MNETPEKKAEGQPNSAPAASNGPPQTETPPAAKKERSYWMWVVTIGLALLLLGWFLLWFFHFRFYQWTDDAYANGNLININTAVSGSVIAFYADDTDLVIEGQKIAELDSIPYQVAYDRELASLASTVLDVRQLYNRAKANYANMENKRVKLERARYDYKNRSSLVSSLAISKEEFIHAQDDLKTADQDLKQAEAEYQVSLDAIGNHARETHPLILRQREQVLNAYYNLKHCIVYAPYTGYVAQRNVNVGEWAPQNRALMAIIPTDYVFVDANYKETQLRYMRVGQPATVTFDIYGSGVVFEGKVLGIASGSGSVFSLIPPQNATGNWIKIVQRLPVRISLDPELVKKYPIRLGISAEVDVDITNTSLPMMVEVVSKKPIATTEVFELDFTEVNQLMDKIVVENLAATDESLLDLDKEDSKKTDTEEQALGGNQQNSAEKQMLNGNRQNVTPQMIETNDNASTSKQAEQMSSENDPTCQSSAK